MDASRSDWTGDECNFACGSGAVFRVTPWLASDSAECSSKLSPQRSHCFEEVGFTNPQASQRMRIFLSKRSPGNRMGDSIREAMNSNSLISLLRGGARVHRKRGRARALSRRGHQLRWARKYQRSRGHCDRGPLRTWVRRSGEILDVAVVSFVESDGLTQLKLICFRHVCASVG